MTALSAETTVMAMATGNTQVYPPLTITINDVNTEPIACPAHVAMLMNPRSLPAVCLLGSTSTLSAWSMAETIRQRIASRSRCHATFDLDHP